MEFSQSQAFLKQFSKSYQQMNILIFVQMFKCDQIGNCDQRHKCNFRPIVTNVTLLYHMIV